MSDITDTAMVEAPPPMAISQAAHQYQVAMSQQQQQQHSMQRPISTDSTGTIHDSAVDNVINGEAPLKNDSPAPGTSSKAPSPAPQRTGTPVRKEAGPDAMSRATSQHPDPISIMPVEVPPHGAPTRQYLNSKVTGVLLEGMKLLAKDQPRDPLRVLGEYLIQRSKDFDPS